MIDIEKIKSYYPPMFHGKNYVRFILREYFQYMILDHLSSSRFAKDICFIGGTNLRLVHGIDRFSEDLDFDIKNIERSDFIKMTDSVASLLRNSGYKVELDDKKKDEKLNAFRRNIIFPEFLYENGLSPFREEKFLIKIESQDQGYVYLPKNIMMKGCGFFFNFSIPNDSTLCAMKLSALLDRQKGRDFYDTMYLLSKTDPDFNYLNAKKKISNLNQLRQSLLDLTQNTDLKKKSRDFEHLVFKKENTKKILLFKDFVENRFSE